MQHQHWWEAGSGTAAMPTNAALCLQWWAEGSRRGRWCRWWERATLEGHWRSGWSSGSSSSGTYFTATETKEVKEVWRWRLKSLDPLEWMSPTTMTAKFTTKVHKSVWNIKTMALTTVELGMFWSMVFEKMMTANVHLTCAHGHLYREFLCSILNRWA